jgi:hypothetical protein
MHKKTLNAEIKGSTGTLVIIGLYGVATQLILNITVNVLMFCLSSRRWFVLRLACIPYLVLVQVSGERG